MRKYRYVLVFVFALLLSLCCTTAWADSALVLPQGLTAIGEEAFYGDTSLDYVIFPEGLREIGARAFAYSSVQTVFMPDSLTAIDDSAFDNTPLRYVITPNENAASQWAVRNGYTAAINNDLRIEASDNEWWVYAPYGETAKLLVDCRGADLTNASVSWFRVEKDENGSDLWNDLDCHDEELETAPVEGHMRYVCRLTDRYGFQNEGWFDVMVDSGLEVWPGADSDHVAAPYGESALLRVFFWPEDSEISFQWYRVDRDENGRDDWTLLEGETDEEMTTPAVTGPAQYVCRITDRFDSMYDRWFTVSVEAGENTVSAGAAHDVSDTAAWIPLTYSVTTEQAQQGYRMGVFYTESPDGLQPNANGRYENAFEWTWGGESGIYGPANEADYEGWLDELIPGHTYRYVACIVDFEGEVIAVDDTIRQFTTTSAGAASTLNLAQHAQVPHDYTKTPFRFVIPSDGVYRLNADVEMEEMSVRTTDDRTLSRTQEVGYVSFYGTAGETLYLFVRDHRQDAEVWISRSGDIPEAATVESGAAEAVTASSATIGVTYSVDVETAEHDYRVGIAFSQNPEDLMFLNEEHRFDCDMRDLRIAEDNAVAVDSYCSETLDELLPDSTYYYLAYIKVDERVAIHECNTTVDDLKSFHTGSADSIPLLQESVAETIWHAVPAEQKTAYCFTAASNGIYGLISDISCDWAVYSEDGRWIMGDYSADQQIIPIHEGETVYIFVKGFDDSFHLAIRRYIDFPTEDSVVASVADNGHSVGSTWVTLDLSYDATEETANDGYYVGVAFSQNPDELELNEEDRFSCDMWEWDWNDHIANDVPVRRHIDQLIPETEYYFRPFILADGAVICTGDVLTVSTAANDVESITPGASKSFSGYQVYPLAFTAATEGMYELQFDSSYDQLDLRREDGRHDSFYSGQERVQFFADQGETLYLFMRSWGDVCHVSLSYIGAPPEQDAISMEIQTDDEDMPYALVTMDISMDTAMAPQGYGYEIQFSPYESFTDTDGDSVYSQFYNFDGEGLVRLQDTVCADFPSMIPGMVYYLRPAIDYHNGDWLFGDVLRYQAADRPIQVLPLSEQWTDVPLDGRAMFRFTPQSDGFYAIEAEDISDMNILSNNGFHLCGTNDEENQRHYALLSVGLHGGESCYIDIDGIDNAQIRVVDARSLLPDVSYMAQPVRSNGYGWMTAAASGWYNLTLNRTDLTDRIQMFRDGPDDEQWLEFDNTDTVSFYLEEQQTAYFTACYNDDDGELYLYANPATMGEADQISVLESQLQIGDTWAAFDISYSLTEESFLAAEETGGYYIMVVLSDGEIEIDDDGNYSAHYADPENDAMPTIETWTQTALHVVANHSIASRTLDRLMPETSYRCVVLLQDSNGHVYAHSQVFGVTTGAAAMPALACGDIAQVPLGESVYRFAADTDGVYAVVSRGLNGVEIRGANGWIASSYSEYWNDPSYSCCQGFMARAGEQYLIFVDNGNEDVTLSVEPADALPALIDGEWSDEYDGRQVFRFTAPSSSWYRFEFESDAWGHLSFADLEEFRWNSYEDGRPVTCWLDEGQTVYPACWFDNNYAKVRLCASAFVPAEVFEIHTLDVQDITDVSARFSAQIAAPILEEGQSYTYGIQLLRDNGDMSFAGGTEWETTVADMSMVRWDQTDPSELRTEFFDDRPLQPGATYWYEAFVGVYDPDTNSDTFYYGGLKSFSTNDLYPDRSVTEIFADDEFFVPYREDEDYQIFTFTVPENPADIYTISSRASFWLIDPAGICHWPMNSDDERMIMTDVSGFEGMTYWLFLREWDEGGEYLTVSGIYAEPVDTGASDVYTDTRLYRFTAPESAEYLIAAPIGYDVVAYSKKRDGFNHRSGWGWITDPMTAGESIIFYCKGDGEDTIPLTITNITPYVDSENALRTAAGDAALVSQEHPTFRYPIYVDGSFAVNDDLRLPANTEITLKAPLTVAGGVTLTNQCTIIVIEGAGLTVNGTLAQSRTENWPAVIKLDGGTLTVNGSYAGDQDSYVIISRGRYADLDAQLAAVSGVPTSAVKLEVDAANDTTLSRIEQLAPSYRHVDVYLAENYVPDNAILRELTENNCTVHFADGSVFQIKIGMVVDFGGVNDHSFNQFAWEGLRNLEAEDPCYAVTYLESQSDTDVQTNINAFVNEDYDLIIGVGFMTADAIREAAINNPTQKFAVVDDSSNADLQNVACLTFAQEQCAYLVGLVAGNMTQSNTVGYIQGMVSEQMNLFGIGYIAGVLEANPQATVLQYNANSFSDIDGGETAARNMITNGADVIFHAAGATGIGMFNACEDEGIWAIGVDADQAASMGMDCILTSAIKNAGAACAAIARDVRSDNFVGGEHHFTLADGALDIATTGDHIPADVLQIVEAAKAAIIAGEKTVPTNANAVPMFTLDD